MALPQCWKDVEDALDAGLDRLILFGPPGTGKTHMALNGGNVAGGAFRVTCTEDMTDFQVTGGFLPAAEGYVFKDGAGIKAWRGDGVTGGRLVLDEIDRANGDVLALLLLMTDSQESAILAHPDTGRLLRPNAGFSAIMTTNLEDPDYLDPALRDRFPVAIEINEPHPAALEKLPTHYREYARRLAMADGNRRVSVRGFYEIARLESKLGAERAATLVLGRERALAFMDAVAIDRVDR